MHESYAAAFAVVVATHVASLPLVYQTLRLRLPQLGSVGFCTMVTSFCYHWAEVLNDARYYGGVRPPRTLLLGLTDGQWHRLDNIFAILSLQSILLLLLRRRGNARLVQVAQWMCASFAVWCQEVGPWDIRFTVYPLALPGALLLAALLLGRAPRLEPARLVYAMGAAVPTFYCFARGLDEERDFLRMYHAGWHIGISAVSYFLLDAVHRRRAEERAEEEGQKSRHID